MKDGSCVLEQRRPLVRKIEHANACDASARRGDNAYSIECAVQNSDNVVTRRQVGFSVQVIWMADLVETEAKVADPLAQANGRSSSDRPKQRSHHSAWVLVEWNPAWPIWR